MYNIVDFGLLKIPKLTIDHLEIRNLENFFNLGSPYDATIDISNVLFHWMIKQINVSNVLFQIKRKFDPNHLEVRKDQN
jgi:hypothetical protein